jgi:sulfite reductase alpha subunit
MSFCHRQERQEKDMSESGTPLLDELEKGPWPSFVTEIKRAGKKKKSAKDLLLQLEKSYRDRIGYWKHGGIVGVKGYGGGVIGRYSMFPEEYPDIAHFHTIRVNMPSGWFYTSKALRTVCDIWDKRGSGLTNMHGSTGDIILLGTVTAELQPTFDDLSDNGFDLGGSGSALRTPSACVGPARCEWSCYDTLDMCHSMTMEFQDELHRPPWPYKFKFKFSGCPNDCVASIARSDLSVIGTWRDAIQVDASAVKEYAKSGLDIQKEVASLCPTSAIEYDSAKQEMKIINADCVRCMHCLNVMPKALLPGKERGATILLGGKAPILEGAMLSSVIVPFMKIEPPYEEFIDLARRIHDWWDENAKFRERCGELVKRVGMRTFLKDLGLAPVPQMVNAPRANPYFFWWPDEVTDRQGRPLKKKKEGV